MLVCGMVSPVQIVRTVIFLIRMIGHELKKLVSISLGGDSTNEAQSVSQITFYKKRSPD
jgi:hypothetical protein